MNLSLNFADDILKYILMNENKIILIKISRNFVPKVPTDDKSELVNVKSKNPVHKPMMNMIPYGIWWF